MARASKGAEYSADVAVAPATPRVGGVNALAYLVFVGCRKGLTGRRWREDWRSFVRRHDAFVSVFCGAVLLLITIFNYRIQAAQLAGRGAA